MSFSHTLEKLIRSDDLDRSEARALMQFLVGGDATPAQVAGVLVALRTKGATGEELASFAEVLRGSAVQVESEHQDLLDTCGTGGGLPSFNISSAAAFVASAAGAKVAKHGNRAVTSACGSADVLEALGLKITNDPEVMAHVLNTVGLAFLFAPALHPAMRQVGGVRKELGVRTVFNQLGPLANPAGAARQLVGVYDESLVDPMAEALEILGVTRAAVVHGHDGMDEVSPCAPTLVGWVEGGAVQMGEVAPSDFGLEELDASVLTPGITAIESAAILRESIGDVDSPRASAVLPSAAMAIYLAELEPTLLAAATRARDAIASGSALRKLEAFIEVSNAA